MLLSQSNANVIYTVEQKEEEPMPKKLKPVESAVIGEEPEVAFLNDKKEQEFVKQLENDTDELVWEAMAPLHTSMGAIAASMGEQDVRKLYRWSEQGNTIECRASAVVKGNSTLKEFYDRNAHLGKTVLTAIILLSIQPIPDKKNKTKIKQEPIIKFEAKIEPHLYGGMQLIGAGSGRVLRMGTEDEVAQWTVLMQGDSSADHIARNLTPSWVWCALPLSAFRFVLSHATFGCLEMVASELGRLSNFRHVSKDILLFDFLSSDDVRDIFCEYVAQRFTKSSGGNAYPAGYNAQQGVQFRFSAGFQTRKVNIQWRRGAKLYIEQYIRYVNNPEADNWSRQMDECNQKVDDLNVKLEEQRRVVNGLLVNYNNLVGRNRNNIVEFESIGISRPLEVIPLPAQASNELKRLHSNLITAITAEDQLAESVSDAKLERVRIKLARDCVRKQVLRCFPEDSGNDVSVFAETQTLQKILLMKKLCAEMDRKGFMKQ